MKQDKHKYVSVILMPIVLVFCFLGFELCFSGKASAVSLTISMSDNSAISLGVAGTEEGSFAKSANRDFTVSTDNITGYTLSIKSDTVSGNDGTGVLLYNGSDDTYVINSIGSENNFPLSGISENVYKNGDSNNNTFTNTWGYKPSMIDSSNNSNFLPAPDATGDTINVTNCANGTLNSTCTNASDTYSITLGAKVDSTVRIGSYSNTFVILAVANAVPYTIIYDDNTVSNMPVDVSSNSQANTIDISSNVPVKDGYSFLGWCDTIPTNSNGVDSCPSGGTIYNPNGGGTNLTYALDRTGGSNNLHLYAMWSGSGGGGSVVPVTINIAGEGVISMTLTNTVNGAETRVTVDDTVVGLVSGVTYNISMLPVSRFDGWSSVSGTLGSASTVSTTYSTTASDTLTVTGNGALFMQDMTLQDCQVNVGTNGNSSNIGDNITVIDRRSSNYPSGDNGYYTVRYINGRCWMTQNLRIRGIISATDSNFTGLNFNVSEYSFTTNGSSGDKCYYTNGYSYACSTMSSSAETGGWYNFYAVTAGTISTNSNTSTVTNDICPAGWHLPTGPNSIVDTDFNKLIGNTTVDYQYATPGITALNALPHGYYYSASLGATDNGLWWSAAIKDTQYSYHFGYSGQYNKFQFSSTLKSSGLQVRCVMNS